MMACFYNASCCVNVSDVLVGGGISKKDASEIIVVQFAVTVTRCLDTQCDPNVLRLETSGCLPYHASYGVIFVAEWTSLL